MDRFAISKASSNLPRALRATPSGGSPFPIAAGFGFDPVGMHSTDEKIAVIAAPVIVTTAATGLGDGGMAAKPFLIHASYHQDVSPCFRSSGFARSPFFQYQPSHRKTKRTGTDDRPSHLQGGIVDLGNAIDCQSCRNSTQDDFTNHDAV